MRAGTLLLKDTGEISYPLGLFNFSTMLSAREAIFSTKCLFLTQEYFACSFNFCSNNSSPVFCAFHFINHLIIFPPLEATIYMVQNPSSPMAGGIRLSGELFQIPRHYLAPLSSWPSGLVLRRPHACYLSALSAVHTCSICCVQAYRTVLDGHLKTKMLSQLGAHTVKNSC